ncbi:MAG: hypothetical protein AB7F22_17405 [Reyranella sp.]|uniref:hypothetical protein n=1 Tax=Reyranella sp. TaxID=1929291 RepID=UPI003D14DD5A
MAVDALLKQFMPPAGPVPAPNAKSQPKPQQKPSDREANPAIRNARDLCDYAYKIMDDIYKDYEGSLGKWETAFGEVLAAVAIANDMRDRTMKRVESERAQDAARAAFINNLVFSLLTMGAMAYVGEFVKAGLPKLQIGSGKTDLVDAFKAPTVETYLAETILVTNKVVLSTPFQFTRMQASVFGEIAKDTGNRFLPLAFPKPPEMVPYRIDSTGGLESLRQDLNKNLKGSKGLVLGEFKKVQQWLNQESEFGEAWLAFSGGSKEQARSNIVRHIETLRNDWAKKWEFFGKSPSDISRGPLAELYERAWWATYVIKALTFFPYNKEMTPESEHFATLSQLGRGDRKLLERAIVDRLRELNVVLAETESGMVGQMQRISTGAPAPEISVEGAIDKEDAGEALVTYRWAKSYVAKASAEAAFKYFPPAKVRQLEPLRAVRY